MLDGFNIRDAFNNNPTASSGGGIYCDLATKLTIRNCFVRNNQAGHRAAVCSLNRTRFDIVFTEFISNVSDTQGGGLWVGRARVDECLGFPSVQHGVQEQRNGLRRAARFYFGNFAGNEWVRFMNVLFQGNVATLGGAGYLAEVLGGPYAIDEQARAELVNCTFTTGERVGRHRSLRRGERDQRPRQVRSQELHRLGERVTP